MKKYTFVIDSAANFIAAFRNHGHLPCISHRLEKSLKQESESRWDSKLEMLESISDQFEMIYDLLTEKDQLERMKQLKILESYDAEWIKNEIRHQYEIILFQLASDKNNDDGSGEDISQFYDSDNDETEENEIDKYLSSKVQKEAKIYPKIRFLVEDP
ncbi:5927_t:CDS:2 [Entrophospora sp. SA101]|nr:5927_t:CDS:2 [Entrophospora sp. SA101]